MKYKIIFDHGGTGRNGSTSCGPIQELPFAMDMYRTILKGAYGDSYENAVILVDGEGEFPSGVIMDRSIFESGDWTMDWAQR